MPQLSKIQTSIFLLKSRMPDCQRVSVTALAGYQKKDSDPVKTVLFIIRYNWP
jgi:hypothetical protein